MLRILLIAIFVVSPACKKVSDKGAGDKSATDKSSGDKNAPVSASRPVTNLGDVVATLQLPSGTKSADVVKLIDNVQPGASALMTGQMPMLLGQVVGVDLSSADLDGPIAIVVLNPEKYPDPALLLVKSSHKDALVKAATEAGKEARSRDGLVLIGAPTSVAAAEAFAFANLARPSKGLVGTVYPSALVKTYQKRFDEFTATMGDAMSGMGDKGPLFAVVLELYKEMFTALGEQSDRVVVTIGSADNTSEIFFRLYAVPGTTVDSFIAAQVPADHKLLARLPGDDGSNMIFSGEMRAGAARDAIFDFSLRATAALYGDGVDDKIRTAMMDWLEAFDGSFAATMGMHMAAGAAPMMSMSYLMGSSDVERMRKGWRQLMTAFTDSVGSRPNMMGMKFDVEFNEKSAVHDGVEIDFYETRIDPSSLDPQVAAAMPAGAMDQKMYMASFDDVAAMSMSTSGLPAIEALIASARKKAKGFSPSARMAQAVEESKKRQESMLIVFDMAELMKDSPQAMPFRFLSMGMGKEAGGALVWRMSISP